MIVIVRILIRLIKIVIVQYICFLFLLFITVLDLFGSENPIWLYKPFKYLDISFHISCKMKPAYCHIMMK